MTHYLTIVPEMILLACVFITLLLGTVRALSARALFIVPLAGLLLALCTQAGLLTVNDTILMNGMLIVDLPAQVIKAVLYLCALMLLMSSRPYLQLHQAISAEYLALYLTAILGAALLAGARHLLLLYLGLELLSLSLYALVAIQRDSKHAAEAAMKYFVLGSLASGMLLYGMSLLYGLTGSLNLTKIFTVLADMPVHDPVTLLALVMLLAGVAFKLGLVPFHVWLADVYQGTLTSVVAMIATVSKLAAFAMLFRLFIVTVGVLTIDWQPMLMVLAVASLVLGNIVALVQTNLKRLLAYSTISHMGFVALGVVCATNTGVAAGLAYTIIYVLTSLAAFGLIMTCANRRCEFDQLADWTGMAKSDGVIGLMVLVVFLSLAGIPPFPGFWAKWFVLKELINSVHLPYHYPLAGIAVFMSVIGAYYYLRVIRAVYFEAALPQQVPLKIESTDSAAVLTSNIMLLVLLGVFPNVLFAVCLAALK